jgi:hypothetical protein
VIKYLIALLVLTTPGLALAANEIAVVNEIAVEKVVPAGPGKTRTVLVAAKSGPPGSRLVFSTSWRNQSKLVIRGIVLNSPALANVVFDGLLTPGEVSVDGGKSWGALTTLKVRTANGTARPAQSADVTNVRLVVPGAAAPGSSGKLSYRVIVK